MINDLSSSCKKCMTSENVFSACFSTMINKIPEQLLSVLLYHYRDSSALHLTMKTCRYTAGTMDIIYSGCVFVEIKGK